MRAAFTSLTALFVLSGAAACGDTASTPADSSADATASTLDAADDAGASDIAAPTVGVAIGEPLAALTLRDCDGAPYALSQLQGGGATWLMLAHGWCPYCRAASALAEPLHAAYAADAVAVANILVQDAVGAAPTAAFCRAWRDEMGQQAVVTLYDPDGLTSTLWEQPLTALNVFLDAGFVIRAKLHSDIRAELEAALDAVLGR